MESLGLNKSGRIVHSPVCCPLPAAVGAVDQDGVAVGNESCQFRNYWIRIAEPAQNYAIHTNPLSGITVIIVFGLYYMPFLPVEVMVQLRRPLILLPGLVVLGL